MTSQLDIIMDDYRHFEKKTKNVVRCHTNKGDDHDCERELVKNSYYYSLDQLDRNMVNNHSESVFYDFG